LEEVSPLGKRRVRGGKVSMDIQLNTDNAVKDASWVDRSRFMVSIFVSMEECMFLLIVTILALSCRTSCWVSVKAEDKELKRDSKSWLRVWTMMKGENIKGRVGPHRKGVMGERYRKGVMGERYHDD
jgi:hypothetical protein